MGYIEDMRQRVGNHPLILIGSHAIILNENNEILLQLRTDFNCWGIIGGALEYNETLEDAVKREVFEETGLTVKNVELFRTYSGPDFYQIYPNGDQVHGVLVVYICREFQGELVCDQTESKELRFFPLDELPSNLPPVIERIITDFQQKQGNA
ncbi:DNA mismatch repair protein MutT [Bacillus mycoides]|uniref:DNA mismatch repair protein MutT n=1 Tax=Bacillus mycoides TaxID=1405 RepID=A0A1D3MSN1_BACMY|nr:MULTISPECIES: NUDIX hydrolase [Bacillus cereus group]EJV70444.1 mutator mutT protein [Bacillus cereus BAG6O-2]OFD55561.1 DNA mismatch repair protein MutT [Bacillus mycoides]OFD61087.1 DNA mismatch repair protein MutT [Bacillus mycoides]OFD90634.1 DNA mismatch repair protein MutT [Bacillus mycoides]OFD94471.1 DNA mismatch repair protein MutT [Bacillus mycoides]